jgi:hypothetical protein
VVALATLGLNSKESRIFGGAAEPLRELDLTRLGGGFHRRGNSNTACQPEHYHEPGVGAGVTSFLDEASNGTMDRLF